MYLVQPRVLGGGGSECWLNVGSNKVGMLVECWLVVLKLIGGVYLVIEFTCGCVFVLVCWCVCECGCVCVSVP